MERRGRDDGDNFLDDQCDAQGRGDQQQAVVSKNSAGADSGMTSEFVSHWTEAPATSSTTISLPPAQVCAMSWSEYSVTQASATFSISSSNFVSSSRVSGFSRN